MIKQSDVEILLCQLIHNVLVIKHEITVDSDELFSEIKSRLPQLTAPIYGECLLKLRSRGLCSISSDGKVLRITEKGMDTHFTDLDKILKSDA